MIADSFKVLFIILGVPSLEPSVVPNLVTNMEQTAAIISVAGRLGQIQNLKSRHELLNQVSHDLG